jgi:hypothetical protein
VLRLLRDAWRWLWAGADLGGSSDVTSSPNPYLAQAPSSGDVDADSRGQGRISS